MNSRDKILASIKQNEPALTSLPELPQAIQYENTVAQYIATLTGIGGKVYEIQSLDEIKSIIDKAFPSIRRIVATNDELSSFAEVNKAYTLPHVLEDVDLAIVETNIAVAENGAVWITDDQLPQRALPFIAQHLAVIIPRAAIIPHMHHAYSLIADANYGYGVFIAGPSKTADIEQSLVLGAHGPATMTAFII